MRRWRGASGLVAALAAACAPRPAAPAPAPAARDLQQEAALARDAAVAFVTAEAREDTSADTLLVPGADFIDGGVPATEPPRLSAMIGRGDASVEDVRTQVAGGFAWIVAVYSWTPDAGGDPGHGRATMILERRPGGWRIRHVHSSSVPPWH
jgi:SnoaL-like protein